MKHYHAVCHVTLVVVLLFQLVTTCDCQQHTFYIRPALSDSSHCPPEVNASQCYNLSTLVSREYLLNSTMLFLPGKHFLVKDLDVRNMEITCTEEDGHYVMIQNVSFVKVHSMSFHSCGDDVTSTGVLQLRSVDHSEISNCTWYTSRSSSIFIEDSNAVLSDCQFVNGICNKSSGGGIFAEGSNVTLTGSNLFTGNRVFKNGGGLSLIGSSIHIDGNLTLVNNLAGTGGLAESAHSDFHKGGGMYLEDCKLTTTDTSSLSLVNNAAAFGGGLYANASIMERAAFAYNSSECGGKDHCDHEGDNSFGSNVLYINNADFSNNTALYGGGIYMKHSVINFSGYVSFLNNCANDGGGMMVDSESQCVFKSTAVFSGNSAKVAGGSLIVQLDSCVSFHAAVVINNSRAGWAGGGIAVRDDSIVDMSASGGVVIMRYNNATAYGGAIALDHSTLLMGGFSEITYNKAQYGGAIHAITSELAFQFEGKHYFKNNEAQFGGGCSLSEASFVDFHYQYTQLFFMSNHADQFGGGLWVEDNPFYSCINDASNPVRRCFFFSVNNSFTGTFFVFENNVAGSAGSALYGGTIDNCIEDGSNFDNISSINDSTNSTSSPVASDSLQICLCTQENEANCSDSKSIEVYSGQQFALKLVGIGQRNGRVPVTILSETDPSSTETVMIANSSCSELLYTITSEHQDVTLKLFPRTPCHDLSLHTLSIPIMIKPCPPGFMLSLGHNETNKSCTCDSILKELDSDIQCDINSETFEHQHGVWIGLNHPQESLVFHPHCPFDYCVQDLINFTLSSSDSQCRYNRYGLICGACKAGFSLTLGGSKCQQCSHVYLTLVIPLAIAGVILVFFLLTFRLTVSMGTLNGLIFFANVVGTNSSIFLHAESTAVLRVFIAWLNLDLGIGTCLFDGLDMYIKVWLQFVFPFYIFVLIGTIVVLSQYSTFVTKCLGSDPVAVLATLILLAYTKLFRTVLTAMSFTYILDSNGSRLAVWLYDGNVRFLSGKHIPLFLFALLIMLLFIVPYTIIVLFAPCLQRHSKNKFLSWVDDRRLKPFLRSYYAPLKDKYRWWVGVLLVVRLCLLIVFVSNSIGDPSINLLAITVAVISLLCWRVLCGTFYSNWCLDALELFYIMKLGIFSVSTLYVLHASGNQRALTDTLVGVAFVVFVAITVYHVWRQLTDSRWWRLTLKPKWQTSKKDVPSVQKDNKNNEDCEEPRRHPQVPTTVIELREPVLEFS